MVSDGTLIVVVTGHGKTTLAAEGPFVSIQAYRWTVETDHGTLTIVKGGGCTCGKPWMTKPSDTELLAAAHEEWAAGLTELNTEAVNA